MEGVFSVLIICVVVFLVIAFFDKFLGIRIVGRGQVENANFEAQADRNALENHSAKDLDEAIRRLERKGYAKTYSNVLSEVRKVVKNRGEDPIEVELRNGHLRSQQMFSRRTNYLKDFSVSKNNSRETSSLNDADDDLPF